MMALDPLHLLRRLEPAVRPVLAAGRSAAPRPPLEAQGFDDLLSLASRGSVHSGRPVQAAPGLDLALTNDQLDRLAAAADVAEAAGATRALMLIDGRSLVMDVKLRQLAQELVAVDAMRAVSVDAAVRIASADEAPPPRPLKLPGNGLPPAQLNSTPIPSQRRDASSTRRRAG